MISQTVAELMRRRFNGHGLELEEATHARLSPV